MKRTIRLLAAPATALLLLSACSGVADEAAPDDPTSVEDAGADVKVDESDSWPIVEDEDGSVVENPEDQSLDDGGDDTASEEGNIDTIESGDKTLELNIDGMAAGAYPAQGRYYLEGTTGVKVLAEVGVEGPTEIEAFRESLGEDPVSYVRFDVDNRHGTEEIGMYTFAMYDAEGTEYEFVPITNATNEWGEDIEGYNDEQWALSDDLDDADLSGNSAVGERREQWLVGPADLPDDVTTSYAQAELFADEFIPMPVR